MFLQNEDYLLAGYSLPPTKLKNRKQTVEETCFGVERPFFCRGRVFRGMEPGLTQHI